MPSTWTGRKRPKVLLIDDDRALLSRANDYLTAHGFDVAITDNLFGIPSAISASTPDLIVLDIRMPALSGDGVATTLGRLCTVPIVFYSAVSQDEGQAVARQHKGATFVSKADGLRTLAQRLTELAEAKRGRDAAKKEGAHD